MCHSVFSSASFTRAMKSRRIRWAGYAADRDSSVGIATRYELEGPGIKSQWVRDFPHPSRPTLGSVQPPIQWVPGLYPGNKTAGAWRWPPTPSSAKVKERVELYLYSSSGPLWPFLGWTLLLLYFILLYFTLLYYAFERYATYINPIRNEYRILVREHAGWYYLE